MLNDNNRSSDYRESHMDDDALKNSIKKARKKALLKHLKSALIMLVVSILLVLFGLMWQDKYTLMAWGDALWLAFSLEFFAAWMMFIYNKNIMSPVIYGLKTFGLMFLGKKPKSDYYEYFKDVEDNPIPKYYYRVIFISAFILLIPAGIILAMVI